MPDVIRPLKVFAFDPSRGRSVGNVMTVPVPDERLRPAPARSAVAAAGSSRSHTTV